MTVPLWDYFPVAGLKAVALLFSELLVWRSAGINQLSASPELLLPSTEEFLMKPDGIKNSFCECFVEKKRKQDLTDHHPLDIL